MSHHSLLRSNHSLDRYLYILSCFTLLFIYLPTDYINLPPYRISEVLILVQVVLYLAFKSRKSFHLNNTLFPICTYYLIGFFTLLFTLSVIPFDQSSFAIHIYLYSCLPLFQYLILTNIRIPNLFFFHRLLP